MDASWLPIVAVAALAGFVQGLSGFGFAMVALSLWAWLLEPQVAAVLSVTGGLIGQMLGTSAMRRTFSWVRVGPFVGGGLLGIPLGLWLLPRVDVHAFRLYVGALLTLWCPVMLLLPRLPPLSGRWRWADGVAGACGGLMGPLGGISGAVPTLWCTLRGFERDVQRGVIQSFNLAMLATTLASYVAAGWVRAPMLPAMALTGAALSAPALVGVRVYNAISPLHFRWVVLGLLSISGLAMLASTLGR